VHAALPDSKALQEVRVQLAGLDLPDGRALPDLSATPVVPVFLDPPALRVQPDLQVSVLRDTMRDSV